MQGPEVVLASSSRTSSTLFGRVQGPEVVFASSSRTSSEDPLWDVPVAGNAAVHLAHEGIAWLFVPVSPPAGAGGGLEQVREQSPVLPAEADDGQEQARVARESP